MLCFERDKREWQVTNGMRAKNKGGSGRLGMIWDGYELCRRVGDDIL